MGRSAAAVFAATLAAQNFIQMSDPQFGMFTKDASFEFAIATANRGGLVDSTRKSSAAAW